MFTYEYSTNGEYIFHLPPPTEELNGEFDTFFSCYEIDNCIIHPETRPKLSAPSGRKCRFCKKQYPVVKFKRIAHIIPELMENRNMVSNFECDDCNALFSKYETQLSYFIGFSRSLGASRGKRGVPTFISPDKKLSINFEDNRFKFISDGLENIHWEIDEEKKLVTFHSVKHPYIPIQVFKILMKIGFCFINEEEELGNLQSAMQFLQNDSYDQKCKDDKLLRLYVHFIPGAGVPHPMVFKMKKRVDTNVEYCPTYCFVIYFANYIYQFFIPGYLPDIEVYKKQGRLFMPQCPILLGKKFTDKFGIPPRRIYELSSVEKIRGEAQVITMEFDNVIFYDENNAPEA